MKSFILICVLVFSGCAQVTSLNLKKHQFGLQPTRIVWIQVAGLDHEHLAMLRFSYPTANDKTALENSMCTGLAWSYNLFSLRPSPQESMLSQITGKKNITGKCEDFSQKPIWDYLIANSYRAGIIEIDAREEESLIQPKCQSGNQDFTKGTVFWSMRPQPPKGAEEYVPSVPQKFVSGQVYWDKTCRMNGCGSALRASVTSLYSQFERNVAKSIFIIRDFSYRHELERRNFNGAREVLRDIDKSVESFYQLADTRNDLLVVVSGAAGIDLEFPLEGKDWQKFDMKGAEVYPRRGELSVPVFARGARSENFCGFYEESQLFDRVLSGPKQQGLELKVINPFN